MKGIFFSLGVIMLLSGCAHNFMRGTVAMKTDNRTGHICLGKNDVKIGEKIRFYRNDCRGGGGEFGDAGCGMTILGTGTITRVLNDHYSEVKTDKPFKFGEGTLVEKIRK